MRGPCQTNTSFYDSKDGMFYYCIGGEWRPMIGGGTSQVMSNGHAAIVSVVLLLVVFIGGFLIGRITRHAS